MLFDFFLTNNFDFFNFPRESPFLYLLFPTTMITKQPSLFKRPEQKRKQNFQLHLNNFKFLIFSFKEKKHFIIKSQVFIFFFFECNFPLGDVPSLQNYFQKIKTFSFFALTFWASLSDNDNDSNNYNGDNSKISILHI